MATNIPLKDDLYNQVFERAKAANTTPEEWLAVAAEERLKRESLRERMHSFVEKNSKRMALLGVEPSDVEREIADYRHGR